MAIHEHRDTGCGRKGLRLKKRKGEEKYREKKIHRHRLRKTSK